MDEFRRRERHDDLARDVVEDERRLQRHVQEHRDEPVLCDDVGTAPTSP
ncbi:MAG: hypothetical protein ABEJ70_07265 [Halobacteriaceae archaeon]